MRRLRPTTSGGRWRNTDILGSRVSSHIQRRGLHVEDGKAVDLLAPALKDVTVTAETPRGTDSHYLSITIDRSSRQPCVITSPSIDPSTLRHRMRRFPYEYFSGPDQSIIKSALAHLQMDAAPPLAHAQTASAISSLASFFREKEAISLSMHLSITSSGGLCISSPHLHFDDAAFKSSKRQADVHALRDVSLEEGVEVEAEKHGIVFVKLHPGDSSANIGTLVNGAGLAMNTVDALSLPPHGGKCANFLDTGGKATSATVKKSFELILQDPRVKVIFVNIFGGLTDCGMIAEGVILAFKEVDMRGVPVVVRLRGTNEEVGQKKIEESGLRLEAFDGFQEAASRVVELARR